MEIAYNLIRNPDCYPSKHSHRLILILQQLMLLEDFFLNGGLYFGIYLLRGQMKSIPVPVQHILRSGLLEQNMCPFFTILPLYRSYSIIYLYIFIFKICRHNK